jgi:hypothetical protein
MADRSSSAVSRWLKLASRSFQARSPAVMTATAAGVNRCPSPQVTPVTVITRRAAEVVSSMPWPAWIEAQLTTRISVAAPAMAAIANGVPSNPPSAPSMETKAKVRSPASLPRHSRSSPTNRPTPTASSTRDSVSSAGQRLTSIDCAHLRGPPGPEAASVPPFGLARAEIVQSVGWRATPA